MIIGLCGKKHSGKDTAAKHLCLVYKYIRYGLADPMKFAIKEIFLLSDEQLWGDLKEVLDARYNTTARKILQVFGTELFQFDIYKHIPELSVEPRKLWINRFKLWYRYQQNGIPIHFVNSLNNEIMYTDTPLDVVISDVRFPHEVDVIREMGGIIVKINRNDVDLSDVHASETEMDEIEPDYVIDNNGSIKDLKHNLDILMEEIKNEKNSK